MSVNEDDFVRIANNLFQSSSDEIYLRNAAARAYYAGYHAATRISAHANGKIQANNGGAHWQLINRLKSHTGNTQADNSIRQIGSLLEQIKPFRKKADYTLNIRYTHNDVVIVFKNIGAIMNLCKQFP
jgi:hypothetical protein